MMKTITTFVSGLLLSAALLLPTSALAAELQPFFTLKLSSVNTLVSVAEKIGTMAGFADNARLRDIVAIAKGIKGVNPNEIAGIAVAVVDDEINLLVLLPITDLWGAEVPGYPNVFDTIRPFLAKRGNDFVISSPFGAYIAVQKQGYLVITPEGIADRVPADPKKLFADLEKYTLGMKLDCEKVEFETLEATVFGPIIMLASMQNPEAGEQIENMVEMYRTFFKEFSVVLGGIAFDPKTADVEYSGTVVPRKGSDWGKMLAGMKQQPTMFGGFRGTPGNTVVSFGQSMTQSDSAAVMSMIEPALKQYETLLNAALEQIEEDDETGETSEFAQNVFDSIRKIIELDTKKALGDGACSLNTEGTFLAAGNTNALEELRKLTAMIAGFIGKKAPEEIKALVEKNLNRNYATVEGFKVSSLKIPVADLPVPNREKLIPFKDLTLGIFWAVKDTAGKQAVAVAAGLDFAKTEQTFKAALEKTKTTVPVQQPVGTVSVQGFGKLLQQQIYPLVVKTNESGENLEKFKKVVDILASAGSDATITAHVDMKPDRSGFGYHVSGKAIQAVISAVRAVVE